VKHASKTKTPKRLNHNQQTKPPKLVKQELENVQVGFQTHFPIHYLSEKYFSFNAVQSLL
jgi:hypothetical protein